MFKNISYLLFGGIKWRLKGFFIGVAVGMALGSFIPDKLAEWLPSAYAEAPAGEYTTNAVSNVTSGDYGARAFPLSSGGQKHNVSFQVESDTEANIESVSFRLARDSAIPAGASCPIIDCPHFLIKVYRHAGPSTYSEMNDIPAADRELSLGEFLGASEYIDYDTLPLRTSYTTGSNALATAPPVVTYPIYESYLGSLNLEPGDRVWVMIEAYWAYNTSNEIFAWYSDYDLRGVGADPLIQMACNTAKTTCAYFNVGSAATGMLSFNWQPTIDVPAYWSIGYGPYVSSSDITYNLPYYCFQAGTIWGYDPDVDLDYIDLGIDCTADEAGFLNLDLSSEATPWELVFEPATNPGLFFDPYSIIIYHDDYGPVIPEDYEEADSGGLCFTILQYAGEDPPPDLDQATVVSMFFTAMGKFVNIPIIGDYVMVNCWVKSGLIDSMVYDNIGTLDVDIAMMGDVDSFVLDLDGVRDQLKGSFDDNAGYDAFRQLMTVLFWASVVFLLWKKFGSDHHDNSNPS